MLFFQLVFNLFIHWVTVSGEGFNVNIPWNRDIMGDAEYKAAFERIVIPIATQFKPDLVLVACGFDAAAADVIGEYIVTPDMFAYMTDQLKKLAGGRVLMFLEGGYNPNAIGQCFEACLNVLLNREKGLDCDKSSESSHEICKRALITLQNVESVQTKYWKLTQDPSVAENL